MSKMRDPLVEVTSAMPFSGRHAIRKTFFLGRKAAEEGNLGGKVKAIAILGTYTVLHGIQALMGVDSAITHAHSSTVVDTLTAGYDTLYAVANAAVTYTQARLLGKLAITHHKEHEPEMDIDAEPGDIAKYQPSAERPEASQAIAKPDQYQSPWTIKDRLVDTACTLGAQILFLATYRP